MVLYMVFIVDTGEISSGGKTPQSVTTTGSFCAIGIKDTHVSRGQEPNDPIGPYAVTSMTKLLGPTGIKGRVIDKNEVVTGTLPFFKVEGLCRILQWHLYDQMLKLLLQSSMCLDPSFWQEYQNLYL